MGTAVVDKSSGTAVDARVSWGPISRASSSSLSSPGRLKTSSLPLTSRRFLIGASDVDAPSSVLCGLDRSFFFCLFARFFAVLASVTASASRLRRSNSSSSCSYKSIFVSALIGHVNDVAHLLHFILQHFQPFVFSPSSGLVYMKFTTSCASTRTLDILHHLPCGPNDLFLWWRRNICWFCWILQESFELHALFLNSGDCMSVRSRSWCG